MQPFLLRSPAAQPIARCLPALAALGLLALLLTLASPAAVVADDESPAEAASDADATESDTAETAQDESDRRLPEFTVMDTHRLRHTSTDWIGEPLLIDFWATWCGPCNFTLPELQSIHEDYDDRGLRLIGISLDTGAGGGHRAEVWARERNVTYEIMHDAGAEARRALGVTNIPVLFLVDTDGTIVADWWGEPDFDEVRARIEEVVEPADEDEL